MSDLLKNPKLCGSCNTPGCKLKCACKLVFYCGAECQGKHWPAHKKECTVWLAKKIRDTRKEHGKDGAEMALARYDAAQELRGQGRYREAERCYLDARRILSKVEGEDSYNVGAICERLGDMYGEMGRYEEAKKEFQEDLRIMRIAKGERSEEAAEALRCIGVTLSGQGKHEGEALARLEEAHSILKETVGPEHRKVVGVLSSKGICYFRMGRLEEARAAHEEALRIDRIAYGDDSDEVATSLQNLGNVFCEMGMLKEARANYEEALRISRRVHGERHPSVASAFQSIAHVLSQQGQNDEALKMHSKALKIQRRVLGEDHEDAAASLLHTGNVYHKQGKHDEALELYEEALAVYTRALGIDNHANAGVYYSMAKGKLASGDVAGAIASARECVRIYAKLGIDNEYSQAAATILRRLEGGA
jgi:tetratricopeptide (TPR) repeat protein